MAILPGNQGELARIARDVTTRFAGHRAAISGVVARYIGSGPASFRPLPIDAAARELRLAVASATVPLRMAPGGELPPCLFESPNDVKPVLRLGQILVERDASNYQRIASCERCSARTVCAGPIKSIAARVAPLARPLGDDERAAGLVPMSEERARVLLEYRSQFFLTSPEGTVRERRIVRVNFHCNQACDFCFVSRELPPVEHERIVKEITEVAERKAVLDLSGGEPTLNPRLSEYLSLARDLGVPEVELQTNAIKMADAAFAKQLVDAGLKQAFVSLHGITPEVCDRVTAAPGTFVKTVQGIKNLISLGVITRLNFVVCGYNAQQLAKFPDFVAREFGSIRPETQIDINFSYVAASTDNVPRDTGLIPRFTDVAWALAEARSRSVALNIRMTGFDSKCGVPACYLPRDIREEHFAKDIPKEELAHVGNGFTKSSACASCELDRRCYGIRTTYAEMYGTDELRPIVNGEVTTAPVISKPTSLRGTVWTSIGLSPSHTLFESSPALLVDESAWLPAKLTWVEASGSTHDREIVQLDVGLREVIKVERASVGAAERAAAEFTARGYVARVFSDGGNAQRSARAIAFVGRSRAAVDEAMAVEPNLVLPFGERDQLVHRMGALLGYPSCCVDWFARTKDQDDATHIERLGSQQQGALSFEQNWVAVPIRLFSHFPCSPTCAATAKLAKATFAAIQAKSLEYATHLERALRTVSLASSADRFALLVDARSDGPDSYRYSGVLSHRTLGVEHGILSRPTFRAFYLEVVAPLEQGNRVRRTPSSLLVYRDETLIREIHFAPKQCPRLLDFTGSKIVRRLSVTPG
ncbi:MAG: radical SAM protein [Polyangiaceae bacterium]